MLTLYPYLQSYAYLYPYLQSYAYPYLYPYQPDGV